MPVTTGRNALLALAVEGAYGVPGTAPLVSYDPTLPLAAGLGGGTLDTAQIRRRGAGYPAAGLPGPKGGQPMQLGHPLTAAHLPEFLQHLTGAAVADGSLTVATPDPGVHRYLFEPVLGGLETSFWGLAGTPPVDHDVLYGIRFGSLALQLTPTDEVTVRLDGFSQHGTAYGPVEPDLANAGTYALGPHLRGLAADPTAGDLWLRVESVGPLTFKALQAPAAPDAAAWAAAPSAWPVLFQSDPDGGTDRGTWQVLLASTTGLDLGVWDENKDPLEVVWPGTAADHGDLAAGDLFRFPAPGWPVPAMGSISGPRFTMAHLEVAVDGTPVALDQVQLSHTHPVEAKRGNASRYPSEVRRTGEPTLDLTFDRELADRLFTHPAERHRPVALDLTWRGRQLTAAWRETVRYQVPAAKITEDQRQTGGPGPVTEQVTLRAEIPDDGSPPVTVELVTDRDWTPAG